MINKIGRILVAIDFSEPSFNALKTAACLAEKCKASLYLLHVHDKVFDFLGGSPVTLNSVANNSSNILTALAEEIHQKSGINPVILEESGYVTEAIIKNAVEYKCDLIIVGTYGASGFRNGYIGTTAYSTIKYSPCPVLVVPPRKKWTSFRKPLFPVRPLATALQYYDTLNNFLEENSKIIILSLFNSEKDTREDLNELIDKIEKRFKGSNVITKNIWGAEDSISRNVLYHAENANSDLVIITPSIDINYIMFTIGPNAHDIINNAKIPVFIINKTI